jgi:hypothetical protein
MYWLSLLAYFFGGAFLTNAVPHFVSGVIVLWGFANLVVAYLLLCHVGAFDPHDVLDAAALGLGTLVMGLFAAWQFGQFHGGDVA